MVNCIDTGFPHFPGALVQIRPSIGENGYVNIFKGNLSREGKEREKVKGIERGKGNKEGKPYRWKYEYKFILRDEKKLFITFLSFKL